MSLLCQGCACFCLLCLQFGEFAGVAKGADGAWFGDGSGCGYYGFDDSWLAWSRCMDLQWRPDLACLVHGGDGTKIEWVDEITQERAAWSQCGCVWC